MVQDSYIALFTENEALFQQNLPAWRCQMRHQAVTCLQEPTQLTFADAYALDYGLNPARLPFKGDPFSLFMCDIPGQLTVLTEVRHPHGSEPPDGQHRLRPIRPI